MNEKKTFWTVIHDKDKCALCVVCARNCHTEALKRDEEGDNLALYFNASLCDGCGDNALCEEKCPESAITASETSSEQKEGYVLLNQSKMVQCDYCEEYFAPVRRLEVIQTKTSSDEINRMLCPLCRRTSLVVDFIEKFRTPGQKAEYRSAGDITRRANKRLAEEDQQKRK